MSTYVRGRRARIIRRREIISELMGIAQSLTEFANFNRDHKQDDPVTAPELANYLKRHTALCLELAELCAVEDSRLTRKDK